MPEKKKRGAKEIIGEEKKGDGGVNIEFVPCHKDRDFFLCLAKDYVDELGRYSDEIEWDESSWNKAMWDSDFIVDGGVLCGFVCKNEVFFKDKRNLLYIKEFFVSEEERHRGVGIEAVRRLVEPWDGDVCLYILDKNEVAKAFWNAVEKELDWKRTERPGMKELDGCELRIYRVMK